MHSFLNQPYPWMYKGKGLWILAGAIFVMALFFNFAFEPFNVYREEHRFSYFTVCLIQALIAAAISLCTMSLAGLFINDTQWKVKKEAMLILFLLILIGTGMFLGREIVYDNPDNFSAKYSIPVYSQNPQVLYSQHKQSDQSVGKCPGLFAHYLLPIA